MKIVVSGHHTDTGDSLRIYVEEHIKKLSKFFDGEIEPRVLFEKEHNTYKSEIIIKDKKGNHAELVANGESEDIHRAFELALDKIAHQARKYHEKVKKSFKKKMKSREKEINLALTPDPNS